MIKINRFNELEFEDKRHTYTLNGFEIPSVTTIMKPLSDYCYRGVSDDELRAAAERGSIVHEAVENYALFGINDIPQEYRGYFDGFKKWIDGRKPIVLSTEHRLYHKQLLYAGTADLLCIIDGVATVVDYKTTSALYPMLTRVQTEAYRRALNSHGFDFQRKIVVQGKKNGTYHEEEHDMLDNESWKVFTELLDVNRYIKNSK